MTLNNHNLVHRMLKARQGNGNNGTNGNNANGNGNGGPAAGSSTAVSQTPAAVTAASDPPVSSATSQKPVSSAQSSTTPTTSQTPKTATSASTSQIPTTTTPSSSTTSTTSSTSSSKSTGITTKSFTATGVTTGPGLAQTSSFANVSPTGVGSPGTTISASAIPTEKTGGVSTGTIVGGVAGGLIGIAVLGMLIAFVLRRLRKRSLEDEDFVTNFRQSAFVGKASVHHPHMSQHDVAPALPSTSIGAPGMAGQGAFRGGVTADHGASAVASSTPVVLQERPRYVYGQEPARNAEPALEDDSSEVAHGAYSTEPEVQQPYNPEAYGSYAAYENGAGYQEATREYQGQQGYNTQNYIYEPQQYQGGYAEYDYAAAGAYTGGNAPASGHAASHGGHHNAYGGM